MWTSQSSRPTSSPIPGMGVLPLHLHFLSLLSSSWSFLFSLCVPSVTSLPSWFPSHLYLAASLLSSHPFSSLLLFLLWSFSWPLLFLLSAFSSSILLYSFRLSLLSFLPSCSFFLLLLFSFLFFLPSLLLPPFPPFLSSFLFLSPSPFLFFQPDSFFLSPGIQPPHILLFSIFMRNFFPLPCPSFLKEYHGISLISTLIKT